MCLPQLKHPGLKAKSDHQRRCSLNPKEIALVVASEDKMQEVNLATGWPRLFSCGEILPNFQKARKVFGTYFLVLARVFVNSGP